MRIEFIGQNLSVDFNFQVRGIARADFNLLLIRDVFLKVSPFAAFLLLKNRRCHHGRGSMRCQKQSVQAYTYLPRRRCMKKLSLPFQL